MARGGQGEGTRPGAEALARAAQDHGAEVVFANPGTTEMHLVGALDAPGLRLRPVLGLHETVSVFSPRAGVSLPAGGTAGPRGGDSPSRPAAARPHRTPDGAARGTLVVPPVSRGRGGGVASAAANPAPEGERRRRVRLPPGGLLMRFQTTASSSGRYSALPCDVFNAGRVAYAGTAAP